MEWCPEKEMSRGLNTDIYGLFWGGKATAGYYICPDVDVACAHPTYKGVGSLTFSYNSLRVSHILAFVLFYSQTIECKYMTSNSDSVQNKY